MERRRRSGPGAAAAAAVRVADPRLDVARGTVAVEYGPLVYCMEAVDNPGHRLDDLTIDTAIAPKVAPVDGTLGHVATIRIGGRIRPRTGASWWPYSLAGAPARRRVAHASTSRVDHHAILDVLLDDVRPCGRMVTPCRHITAPN